MLKKRGKPNPASRVTMPYSGLSRKGASTSFLTPPSSLAAASS
jgi:hypothetical protein